MAESTEVHEAFLEHTRKRLDKPELSARFEGLKLHMEELFHLNPENGETRVLDVGCGMGVQSLLWANAGYSVTAMDIDGDLQKVGKEIAQQDNLDIEWITGSAVDIPRDEGVFDVCLSVELLEHVPDWESCLNEFCRVVKPGGVLLRTTTNTICPKQSEFNLPLYSWWPGMLKRRMERLAVTTKPELANYSDFPAVNWFNFFDLSKELSERGFETFDRFDAMFLEHKPQLVASIVKAARSNAAMRALLYLFVEGTIVFARKRV